VTDAAFDGGRRRARQWRTRFRTSRKGQNRRGNTMPPLSNLATRDVETLVHPYITLAKFRENGPLIIERADGVTVYDSDGKPYIEGMAGLWCTALGYGNEELVEAATAQMRKLSFAHLFTGKSHDPAIELAEKLKEIAPVPI
jgi:4-aminobutyrate---pyruvate transaminase